MRTLQSRALNFLACCRFLILPILVLAICSSAFAQSNPLKLFNNYFVTGDYVVAGAQGLSQNISNGYATGTISVPDANPGINGTKKVPAGAQIVGAFLYWGTVEKTSVQPGQSGSGEIGFFRPVYKGGPQTGYQISGVPLELNSTVSFSSGGCSGTSTGKLVRLYRADVRPLLAQDQTGNIVITPQYEVRLPSTGNNTPLTLGATLVIIYRVLSPNVPLNSIVIYDGAYANTSAAPIMSQTLQGFYQAAAGPVSRITHIVGSGQSNKYETVSLNNVSLPSLYPNQPPFPGYYGNWDNPTWTFSGNGNPIKEDNSSATTIVAPAPSNQGCVAWGAVIVSTTVKNTDNDGILDVWKTPPQSPGRPGYCDAAVNEGACSPGDPSWVDLPGAVHGQKDVFVQLDYMCSSVAGGACAAGGGNYSFDPRLAVDPADGKNAVTKVVDAYANNPTNPIHLHVIAGNAIQEPVCTDNTSTQPPKLCTYPNQPGVVGWKGGLVNVKNQLINPVTGAFCNPGDANCFPVFQHGKKDSHHYALFAHAVGLPSWTLSAKTLSSAVQSGTLVTFTTSTPHGLTADAACPQGRVSVNFAITNPKLNGVYCVQVTGSNTFTITAPNSVKASYTFSTDPNLAVATGHAGTVSGFSDVGGADSLITLGNWGPDGETWQTKAGTFMHELGHGNGLTHSGFYFDNLTKTPGDYTPTIEANCKSNFQSVMNYLFQVDLLDTGLLDATGHPLMKVDYSEQGLNTLTEATATAAGVLTSTYYPLTSWYVPFTGVGTAATQHCDGTAIPNGAQQMVRVPGLASTLSFVANQDINFDGNNRETLRGHKDWTGTSTAPGIDLRQVGATGSLSSSGVDGLGGGGGVDGIGGGGGIDALGGGGGIDGIGGGGGVDGLGGGGGVDGLGGGGGQGEISHDTANSVTRPPRNLTASEAISARTITLNWVQPTFGQIGSYNIYRSDDGGQTFAKKNSVAGNQLTYSETPTCKPTGYQYFVTAVLANTTQESVQSNTVPGPNQPPLTGCYTVSGFLPLANAVHGSIVPITWNLTDDFYTTGTKVNRQAAISQLVAIGPIGSDASCTTVTSGQVQLISNGTPTTQDATTFSVADGQFTFSWDTDVRPICAGSYTFELDLDSGQKLTSPALLLSIDVADTDSTPHIVKTPLSKAIAGVFYTTTILQHGGTPTLVWSVADGSTPPGLTLDSGGTLSGTATDVGTYDFTVKVTDANGNSGTQPFEILVVAPVAQINQPLLPESLLLGGAAPTLTIRGEGFYAGSTVLWNGTALATSFVTPNQLTATVPAPPAPNVASLGTASITVANKNSANSNVDFFQISDPITAVSFFKTDQAVGMQPKAVIAADFNGDGKLDLAVANSGDGTVSILIGAGDGTFTPGPVLTAGNGPSSLAVGDFNKDGKLDLAVTNFNAGGGNTVSIFLGAGNGSFGAASTVNVGTGPVSIMAADFDRDGKLDLAVVNQANQTVSILLGNGDSTFQTKVDYAVGTTDVGFVAVGDFNSDNKLDLAVTSPTDNKVAVFLGNGDGTFRSPATYPTGPGGPLAVSALDVNADGKLDLAVANVNTKNVAILIGNGDGTFASAVTYSTTSGESSGPGSIASGDFNADGKIDLAITNSGNNSVALLLGNGDGTFQMVPRETTTGVFPAGVAAGDFNGNGRLDLAVANTTDGTVSVMLQRPQAPTNLAPGTVTASQVPLTWTASVSTTVTGYNVRRADVAEGPYLQVKSGLIDKSTTAYTDSTVVPGKTYYYVVTAVDPHSLESVYSSMVSVTTPPLPPTNLAAGTPTTSQVPLSWTASVTNGVAGYNVYRSTTSGSGYTKVNAALVSGTSYNDTSVASNTTYYYVVTAVTSANVDSAYSNQASATTPPLPPTNLATGTPTTTQVPLTWTASTTTSVTGYNVYRGPYPMKLTSTPVPGTNYTDTSVSANTTYYYVVTAVGAANVESAYSNEASATTPPPPQ